MTDLDPSPLVAVLAQSLLKDVSGKKAIIKELATKPDVQEQFHPSEGDELKTRIAEYIDQHILELVTGPRSVPVGYRRARGGRVRRVQQADAVTSNFPYAAATVLASPHIPFEFVMLVGYLSPGPIAHTRRLYVDPTLDDFMSLREEDIVFRHRFDTQYAPFDEVDVVWVKRAATIGSDRRQPRRAEVVAKFLEGELMDAADAGSALPTRIEGSASDEPFCVSFTCCKRTSVCRPRRR
jgi:hypothetical protein